MGMGTWMWTPEARAGIKSGGGSRINRFEGRSLPEVMS
jgi:hypothetical protein